MNKPAYFFAATTGLFLLTTLYFAWQLNQRDANPPAKSAIAGAAWEARPADSPEAAARAAAENASTAQPATIPPLPGVSRPGEGASANGKPATADGADSRRSIMLPFARDFLRQYDDLPLRDALVANARRGLESQYAALRDRLGLDPATFDRLVSLLAEEQLEQQANYFRCVVDSNCNPEMAPAPRDRSDEVLALLGAEGHAQFTSYRDAMPEWQSVIQLRGRLSESQSLRDGEAERLRAAMTEFRKRFAADLQQQGAKLQGWGNGSGMLWYSGDGTVEQQLASATQYSQNLRRQAATLLNAEQLRLFAQLQDELLAGFGAYLQQAQSKGD